MLTKNSFSLTYIFYATKHWKTHKTLLIQDFSLKQTECKGLFGYCLLLKTEKLLLKIL